MSSAAVQSDVFYKIVIVGDSTVGKSCLLSRFSYNEFQNESKSTIGVDFSTKLVELNNKTIKVQVWDTAGQERFRAISRVFYSNASAAIVAYDVTNVRSFINTEKWIDEIREKCEPGITIILVGNKIDLKHLVAVTSEQGEEYAIEKNLMFLETSAKDSTNVEEAFLEVIQKTYTRKTRQRNKSRSRKLTRFIHLDFRSDEKVDEEVEISQSCCSIL